jgi:hypothetical protein
MAGTIFGPPTPFDVGDGPASVAMGDLNGDGKPDLAVTNHTSNTVSVLLGNGDGTFGPKHDFATDAGPWTAIITDLNADSKSDLVVANANTLSILMGNGDGTFAPKNDIDVHSRTFFASVTSGDLNGDGHVDLVVAGSSAVVWVLLGNGDGTFMPPVFYRTTDGLAFSVAIGDLNADSRPDVAVAVFNAGSPVGKVSVLLGNGDGTFGTQVQYDTGFSPTCVVISDLNGDGKLDLVTADPNPNQFSVLLGNGDGSFAAHMDYDTGMYPFSVAVGDVNGDGHPDLVTGVTDSVSVHLGKSDGTFAARDNYYSGGSGSSFALGDLNHDARLDAATPGAPSATGANIYTVSVLLNVQGTNSSPDCSHAEASPSQILSRNHKFVPISITGVTDTDGDPLTITVTRVTQDEPLGSGRGDDDEAGGDGSIVAAARGVAAATAGEAALDDHADHSGGPPRGGAFCADAIIDRSGAASLRGERMGKGNGRVYTIWFTASDGRGGSCDGSVAVCVPHDNRGQHGRNGSACVDDGQAYNSLGPCSHGQGHDGDGATIVTLKVGARAAHSSTIEYSLPAAAQVHLAVYDVGGRKVAALAQASQNAGTYTVEWNTRGVARGMYFCRLQVGATSITRSLLVTH